MKLRIETNFETMLFTESGDFEVLIGERTIDKKYEMWINYITIYTR
jgi:hypothetical protein